MIFPLLFTNKYNLKKPSQQRFPFNLKPVRTVTPVDEDFRLKGELWIRYLSWYSEMNERLIGG